MKYVLYRNGSLNKNNIVTTKIFSIESQSKEKPVGRINACNVLLDIAQSPQVSTYAVKTVVVDLFSFNPRNSCTE